MLLMLLYLLSQACLALMVSGKVLIRVDDNLDLTLKLIDSNIKIPNTSFFTSFFPGVKSRQKPRLFVGYLPHQDHGG